MYQAKESRYEQMDYRFSGESGLRLPAVSLGLWHNFGDSCSFANMQELCFTAFDQGITHFDLANNYGPKPGSAEKNFGRILKEDLARYRDELIISTKAGYDMWEGPYGNWGSRKHLLASLDQSLKRLQLDYVDIFYHHRMDPQTPLKESMLALAQAVQSGKALYVGLSNYDGPTMERAYEILDDLHVPYVINQNCYNLLDRSIEENGLLAMSRQKKVGVISFSPLAKGQLSNRYLDGIPADSRVARDSRFLKASDLTEQKLAGLRKLNDLAAESGHSLAQLALKWNLQQEGISSVLIGASKPDQILDNVAALNSSELSAVVIQQMEMIASGLKK